MSTCRTGVSRLARREDLAAPEAGDSLEDALLACATICFQVAMAAYRTEVNGQLADSSGRLLRTQRKTKSRHVVWHEKLGSLAASLAIVSKLLQLHVQQQQQQQQYLLVLRNRYNQVWRHAANYTSRCCTPGPDHAIHCSSLHASSL